MTLHNLIVERMILLSGRIKRQGNTLRLNHKGRNLSFIRTEWAAYPLNEVFVKEEYASLGVNGRNVVDIGASIADSPIYFALEGAKHVYGYEPDAVRYNMALENIKANGLEDRITMYNTPYDGRHSENAVIKIDCEGCEYALVREFDMGKFDEAIMEYHKGRSELESMFSDAGFSVRVSELSRERGILYARRKAAALGAQR
ncbi:MAG: hypothetical protein KGI06_02300 [Candidatus Micrarchaeota archaeon]|nr:hypothetical protein [Candidatus Micrarchaeota archaeon]